MDLQNLLQERIVLLDGAMGTMLQKISLEAEGATFACNELLNLTHPALIMQIHRDYLEAGADIIETNTFGANRLALQEFQLERQVYDINLAACKVARRAVEEAQRGYVAGVIGPTGKMASLSSNVEDLAYREVTFDDFEEIYREQIEALIDGGVDVLLIETVFDTLVAKAALFAAYSVMDERSVTLPVMVSVTLSDQSGRTLSGQTLAAFVETLSGYPLFSLGLNCSTGAQEMLPFIRELAQISPFLTSAHPNGGFPDHNGRYTQSPQEFAQLLKPLLEEGLLNIVGGCCGTTPSHIASLREVASKGKRREAKQTCPTLRLSGLETLEKHNSLIIVGERTNVAGSRKFARLIREKKYTEALAIAKDQIDKGAHLIDICMDDPLLDSAQEMTTFLRLCASEPEISRLPFVVDSSSWETIVASLKEIQGRCIVNSISLKEGEDAFLDKARFITKMGAAIMVMCFDEKGQGDTFERKCAIAHRSYKLLLENKICEPASIIFDPNVLAIATGIAEHDAYGADFIKATKWIKENLPGVSVSGGLSNLSFAFRGNNSLREAIHAVFLEEAALDMAIINPAAPLDTALFPTEVVQVIKRVLSPSGDKVKHREELIALALKKFDITHKELSEVNLAWRNLPVEERLTEALVKGEDAFLEQDLAECLTQSPVELIEGPLLRGMERVGSLFAKGEFFLPQVVRSARVMKRAVDLLEPRLLATSGLKGNQRGTVLLATVKGDVHDIGKNIFALVLECNNFKVIDLGVMVEGPKILEKAIEHKATIVGLSGLITPSLAEMGKVCTLFKEAGMKIPLLIGGATTSETHTALRLSPLYNLVVHAKDASDGALCALALSGNEQGAFLQKKRERYAKLAEEWATKERPLLPFSEAITKRFVKKKSAPQAQNYGLFTIDEIDLDAVLPFVNWAMVASAWRVPLKSKEGQKVIKEAQELLDSREVREVLESSLAAVIGLFRVEAHDEHSFTLLDAQGKPSLFRFLRSQKPDREGYCRCLADYVNQHNSDTVGLFVATAALRVKALVMKMDTYKGLLLTMVSDRLAEALSSWLEEQLKSRWWGFGEVPSIRPAVGYPMAPDHMQKKQIFELLEAEERIKVALSGNYAMIPTASVCGFYFVGEGLSYFNIEAVTTDQKRENRAWRDELELWLG